MELLAASSSEPEMEPTPLSLPVVLGPDVAQHLASMLTHSERLDVTSLSRSTAASCMREQLFRTSVLVIPGFSEEPLHRFLSSIPERCRMAIRAVRPSGSSTLPLDELAQGATSTDGMVVKNMLHIDFTSMDLPVVLPQYFPQLERLDLSKVFFPKNVGLTVERLPQLKSIHCSGLSFDEADIKGSEDRLEELRTQRIAKFSGLVGFHKLRLLHCARCDLVRSLKGLETLTQLESLSLTGLERLDSFSELTALTNLRFLELKNCRTRWLSPDLSFDAPSLVHLNLESTSCLSHLDFLATMPRLKYLNIAFTKLRDLFALKHCMELETLVLSLDGDVTEATMPDYSVLAELPKLSTVRLFPSKQLCESPMMLVRLCQHFPPTRRPQIVME
ncbi:hypothetical protein ATCC90586_009706 [Pythium insidiosum]|nr:hypothetical protein ATCC90586_009706 [Pythium insidiosum]